MQNWAVDQDTHLVCSQVKKDLEAMYGARRGLRRGGSRQLEFGRDGFLPLQDLVVEVAYLFDIEGVGKGRVDID